MDKPVSNDNAAVCDRLGLDPGVINILGEVLWHSATLDTSIVQVSREHMGEVVNIAERHLSNFKRKPPGFLKRFLPNFKSKPLNFLEVASYAHITGYLLAQQYGWNVTLSDISVQTLAMGARHAQLNGYDTELVRRVAIDFHDLPFPDGAFDIVYIASALHHTLRWQLVLKELLRVTAAGGLLILQNEPCRRHFCFYKFPTNRLDAFRPIEIELKKQGILNTIAEPYPGSRPESLFGMIENQKMPLSDILGILNSEGTVENLTLNSSICMSKLDNSFLASPRDLNRIPVMIENELITRIDEAKKYLTATDTAMGYCLPTPAEVTEMAQSMAERLVALPAPGTQDYQIALAELFGASVMAVVRKSDNAKRPKQADQLLYKNGEQKGVVIGYPPRLATILGLARDLVPDIQAGETSEILQSFPSDEWAIAGNSDLRYLALTAQTGNIKLNDVNSLSSNFIILVRVYGAPGDNPFRIQLLVNNSEVDAVDVYQTDSFLLIGQVHGRSDINLSLHVCGLNQEQLTTMPPVTLAAVRVVCIPS